MTDRAQSEKEDAHWLLRYVKHGAPDNSTLRQRVLGFYLHWRTWGLVGTMALPYLVGVAVYGTMGGYWAMLAGIFVAFITGGWALKVGQKYNVSKNY